MEVADPVSEYCQPIAFLRDRLALTDKLFLDAGPAGVVGEMEETFRMRHHAKKSAGWIADSRDIVE